jgi:hypothetical protein
LECISCLRGGAACGAAFLSAEALTRVGVKGGSELIDPLQDACGDALAETCTNLVARVATCLKRVAVKGGSEQIDLFQDACGASLAEMCTDLVATVATCMKESSVARLDAVLSGDMIEGLLPGFAHSVLSKLGEVRHKLLREELSVEVAKCLESVADVWAGAWLDSLPLVSNCHLGDGDVGCALRHQLGRVCPASMQVRLLLCECGKRFSAGQAMCCRCCAGVHTVCHDVAADFGWRACVDRSAQPSTREPADAHMQGNAVLDPDSLNGKHVDFHVFDTFGSFGCDATIVDYTYLSYLGKYKSVLFREAEQAKTQKHLLNVATMVPLVICLCGEFGPTAEGCLQNLATVTCSTIVVDRGVWLRTSRQHLIVLFFFIATLFPSLLL